MSNNFHVREAAIDQGLTRRAALGLAVAATVTATAAAAGEDHEHEGHYMGPPKHEPLVAAALECVKRGELCSDHCLMMLGMGNTELKDCMRSVQTMLPMCQALARLAALDATRLKAFAAVCRDVCADCEEACKKHADKHALCKACMESCAACIKECKAVIDG